MILLNTNHREESGAHPLRHKYPQMVDFTTQNSQFKFDRPRVSKTCINLCINFFSWKWPRISFSFMCRTVLTIICIFNFHDWKNVQLQNVLRLRLLVCYGRPLSKWPISYKRKEQNFQYFSTRKKFTSELQIRMCRVFDGPSLLNIQISF